MKAQALGAALAPMILLTSCRKAGPRPTAEPRQVLEEFSMNQTQSGRLSWTLKARTALLRDDAQTATMVAPQIDFYKDNKISSQVTAITGLLHTDTHAVRLSSAVVVTSLEDGTILKTEELDYSPQNKKFMTEKDVRLTRPGGVLQGRGLEANEDLSEIRIFNQRSRLDEAGK